MGFVGPGWGKAGPGLTDKVTWVFDRSPYCFLVSYGFIIMLLLLTRIFYF